MRRLLNLLFRAGLTLNAALTRSPLRHLESAVLTPLFVRATWLVRGKRAGLSAAASLGAEWERLLGNKRAAHVTSVTSATAQTPATAFGEIAIRCPLRGTGDVAACHRLMGYDRALLEAAGGTLVVLESQASVGVTKCRVAIRRSGERVDDLPPAFSR